MRAIALAEARVDDAIDALAAEAVPETLKFPHVASLNWQTARAWKKNASLVVTIDTSIDGDGTSITATRTVVLAFDWTGKEKIVESTINTKPTRIEGIPRFRAGRLGPRKNFRLPKGLLAHFGSEPNPARQNYTIVVDV